MNWTQRVSQTYEGGGFTLQARDVLDQALARTGAAGDTTARVTLLSVLANAWEQDRNLLKAASYLEQALAAAEAQPATAAHSPSSGSQIAGAVMFSGPRAFSPSLLVRGYAPNNGDLYARLFRLYRQLGRPQDAAAVINRVAAKVKNNSGLLASLYQQAGQIDEAAAVYKRQAAEAADPQQAAGELQALANLYQSAQRYNEAAAAMQQAIVKADATGDANWSPWMRQSLANIYRQAGQTQAADNVYQQLLARNQQFGDVVNYAYFLENTQRAAQAEKLLTDYQTSHSIENPGEQSSLMSALAEVERLAGKSELADEYQRRAEAGQEKPARQSSPGADAMQRANAAIDARKLDEALNYALQALDAAHDAAELYPAQQIAERLAMAKATAKADEIYRRSLTLAQSWSAATVTPLVSVQSGYAAFLQNQRRWSELDQVLEHSAATITAACGAGTGWLENVLRQRAQVAYEPDRRQDALNASRQWVELQESLSGNTSEPYLNAIEMHAGVLESNQDRVAALPLRVRAAAIADLVYTPDDFRRATAHINAALAYATAKQFPEADALAAQAVELSQHMRPPQPEAFQFQLQQILQMKQAAQASAAPRQ